MVVVADRIHGQITVRGLAPDDQAVLAAAVTLTKAALQVPVRRDKVIPEVHLLLHLLVVRAEALLAVAAVPVKRDIINQQIQFPRCL